MNSSPNIRFHNLKKKAHDAFEKTGYEISRKHETRIIPKDMEADTHDVIRQVMPFTQTSYERLYALQKTIDYLVENDIAGDIVEAGVWKGGSAMAALLRLVSHDATDREIWLYDTYEGMPPPTQYDVSDTEGDAADLFEAERTGLVSTDWNAAGLAEVKRNIATTGYPEDRIRYVEGLVERTLKSAVPDEIALLRLDTDFYESTKVELEVLYERVVTGGVVLIDDYGTWKGARKAVDDFLETCEPKPLLVRLDWSCRLIIKP